jgi:beta-fructofuranosidase
MWECPILLRWGERVVLFVCPHPEAKYIHWFAGDRENGCLREQRQGPLDRGRYAYAANALYDPVRHRYLLWTWIKEGRPGKVRRAAGWAGLLSLPKECGLDRDYHLTLKPAAELEALRTESRTIQQVELTPSSLNPFSGFSGDGLEFEAELSFTEPSICELSLRASPDNSECTTIYYDSAEKLLTVDGSKSSLDPEDYNLTFSGPLLTDQQGVIRFRAFLDRSVLEVFLADAACITQRLYPTREDSLQVRFAVKKGSVLVHRLTAWKLAPIWPHRETTAASPPPN